MDNKIIEQLREEAKDALIHWAKTDKGYFMLSIYSTNMSCIR